MVDATWLSRLHALAALDAVQADRRDVLPPWYGQPEYARVEAAYAALLQFDPGDRSRPLTECEAELCAIDAEIAAAVAERDACYRASLDEPRPSLRRLRAELARGTVAALEELTQGVGALAYEARMVLDGRAVSRYGNAT